MIEKASLAQEVALTFDDLPAHAPLPPGVTRAGVAKQIIKALESAHAPKSYGFMNAGNPMWSAIACQSSGNCRLRRLSLTMPGM